jgi:hypothetical protein
MPKILDSMVKQLEAKGRTKPEAYAISTSQLKKHGDLSSSGGLTPQGSRREKMGHEARVQAREKGIKNYCAGGKVITSRSY